MPKLQPKLVATSDKLIIYQLLPRLFSNQNTTNTVNGSRDENGVGKFADITNPVLRTIRQFGASHIWLTGILEHGTQTDYRAFGIAMDDPSIVKGRAGSPYAVKDYYDVDPDLAVNVPNRMREFEALVARIHGNGMKVIIDFVPNHVFRQYKSDSKPEGRDLGEQDNTSVTFAVDNNFYYLPGTAFVSPERTMVSPDLALIEVPAKVTGSGSITATPDINDWYETVKLNYGYNIFDNTVHFDPIPATWLQMRDVLLFWAKKGIDAFRCDMAQLVPVAFWKWVIAEVKAHYPACVFIAEIYIPELYAAYIFEGGFDYLYDKVGLYDCLRRLTEGHGSCYDITRLWQQESGLFANKMLRFLETHDEQRIASRFFARDGWAAVPAMTVAATLHTGPYLIYFGQEVGVRADGAEGFSGDDGRTTIFDYWGLPEWQGWINNGQYDGGGLSEGQRHLRGFYQQLNQLVNNSDAIRRGRFFDLQYANDNGQSAGYDAHQLYSYLRYTDRQKMLIVCNFSASQSYDTHIRIPAQAYAAMRLDAAKTYRLVDVFMSQHETQTNVKTGVPLLLPPRSVFVLEILLE